MERDQLSFYETENAADAVSILSIPLELGSDERGLADAPRYLHEHGLEKMLEHLGREIAQSVTIAAPRPRGVVSAGTMKNIGEIVSVAKRSRVVAQKAAQRGDTVLALGGDHSISLGSIAGAAAAHHSLGLIYIDAHPDCTTDETTISGNVHGMIVSSAIGKGHKILTDLFRRTIQPEHVLYIGIKDIDRGELDLIREYGLKHFTMLDIAKHGTGPVSRAVDALAQKVDKVWVSLDLDSIDEQDAPGVAMTTPGGLTRREIVSLAHHIGKVCDIAGLDIAEMLPAKDKEGMTARLAIELIARFLGGEYSWYNEYMQHYRQINVANEQERVKVRRAQAQGE